jgi:hypothetical protein
VNRLRCGDGTPKALAPVARGYTVGRWAPDLVLDSSASAEPLPLPGNLRVLRIAPDLATVPALDLAARVRALHEALYPDG